MQTFLPYPSVFHSLRCLDNKRLGKQRVEAMQILDALKPTSTSRWRNHPAVKMWKGYENALTHYMNEAVREWERRGFRNIKMKEVEIDGPIVYPPWFGNADFHASHRSNLLRKKPEWYSQFGWKEPSNMEYVWND